MRVKHQRRVRPWMRAADSSASWLTKAGGRGAGQAWTRRAQLLDLQLGVRARRHLAAHPSMEARRSAAACSHSRAMTVSASKRKLLHSSKAIKTAATRTTAEGARGAPSRCMGLRWEPSASACVLARVDSVRASTGSSSTTSRRGATCREPISHAAVLLRAQRLHHLRTGTRHTLCRPTHATPHNRRIHFHLHHRGTPRRTTVATISDGVHVHQAKRHAEFLRSAGTPASRIARRTPRAGL